MTAVPLAEITGKLIDVGDLEFGRGVMLEVDGQDVSLVGLTKEESKAIARSLGKRLILTIRLAEPQEAPK